MREKAIRIFKYLSELKKLGYKVAWDIASYGYTPIWISEIPQTKGVKAIAFNYENDDSGIWLEVKKQKLPEVPIPPTECLPWIEAGKYDNHILEPKLLQFLKREGGSEEFEYLENNPAIKDAFGKYLNLHWRPWAAR